MILLLYSRIGLVSIQRFCYASSLHRIPLGVVMKVTDHQVMKVLLQTQVKTAKTVRLQLKLLDQCQPQQLVWLLYDDDQVPLITPKNGNNEDEAICPADQPQVRTKNIITTNLSINECMDEPDIIKLH